MNLVVHGKARHKSLVAQWLEHPTGVRKVMGSISVGDSDFFLSSARDTLITSFLISSLGLKFTIFLCLSGNIYIN